MDGGVAGCRSDHTLGHYRPSSDRSLPPMARIPLCCAQPSSILRRGLLFVALLMAALSVLSLRGAEDVPYSSRWFGPHALPVPPIEEARIGRETLIATRLGSSLLSRRDQSQSLHLSLEIPLLREVISVRAWGCILEHYCISDAWGEQLGVRPEERSGWATSDYYVQARIRLLSERSIRPSIILNTTLKTASSKTASTRRSFDTPGYYFSLELGKDLLVSETLRLRAAAQLGFLCWETGSRRQDDAYMYGLQLSMQWLRLSIRTDLSGYTGWMYRHPRYRADHGDRPITWRMEAALRLSHSLSLTADLERGLRDYPFTLVGLGLRMELPALTPRLVR